MQVKDKRREYDRLGKQLDDERSTFISHWTEIGENIAPRRPRFHVTDVNMGDKRFNKILDNTPVLALRTLKSGMMSGITSPARPWFRLDVDDPELAESQAVKMWLSTVTRRMISVFLKSNLYNVLPTVYGDLGSFATSAMLIEEDQEDILRCRSLPIGSYSIGTDHRGRVNMFKREFTMTVDQIVRRFGLDTMTGKIDWTGISDTIKGHWENDNKNQRFQVCHVILPNPDYKEGSRFGNEKKFRSTYYENHRSGKDQFLRESGYDYFPVLCPRWETTGEDSWGTTCPGMESLGDCKALQLMKTRLMEAIEKYVRPPMKGPTSLRNSRMSIIPGDVSYDDTPESNGGFRPVFEVEPRVRELMEAIMDHQKRIQRTFYEDLFLMLANSDRRQITATEIEERHEEKLLALGPVLEQLNQDLLDPLIEITFGFMYDRGLIPEVPEELQDLDIKVEYISMMAQAQKLVGIGSVERMVRFAGEVGQTWQGALDKIDGEQAVDIMADLLSAPPGLVRSDEQLKEIQEQRAEAEQANARAASAAQAAKAVKDLSQADMSGENALNAAIEGASSQGGIPQ